jgi:hypothetical protein
MIRTALSVIKSFLAPSLVLDSLLALLLASCLPIMAQAQHPPGRILTTGNNLQIIECNIDASNCFTIFQEYEGNISFPAPQSPSVANNGMIAFTSTVAPDGSCPGGCYPHVFVVNADGTNVVQLTDNSSSYNSYGEHHPVISPDGTMVAFLSNLNQAPDGGHPIEVYVVNTDGSNLRQVTPFQQNPNISSDWSAYMTGMAWSPDSKSLAFRGGLWTYLCGTYFNTPAFNTAIGTIGADGSNLQVLTCDGNDGYVNAIDWSADGSLLAWNRNVNHCAQGGSGCAGEPAMAFYDFTGQNRYSAGITSAQLNTDSCQGDVRCIHFSPDGTQLAYRNTLLNSGGCNGQCYLSIISLDGNTRTDTTVPSGGDFWWMAGPAVPAAARMTLDPQVLEFWPGFSRQLVPSLLDGGGNLIMHTANVFTNPFLYAQMCQPQI